MIRFVSFLKVILYILNELTDADEEIVDPCFIGVGTNEIISEVRLIIYYSLSTEYSLLGYISRRYCKYLS